MNYNNAKEQFEKYLNSYDRDNGKVRLKIIHTYGVVHDMTEICKRMQLSDEDTELARIIALLHDIGRFEQLKRFDSFEPTTMDHAAYGVQVLFEEGMIRQFVPESTWDDIIHTAIARHSDFKLEGITDPLTLLHARLIRDADKLDNCRVKLEDDLLVFMGASGEEIGAQAITPVIYDTVFKNQCVYSPDRVTRMDYWVSYVAYFLDINYRATLDIIEEHDYLNKIIDRIPYSNPDTRRKWKTSAHIWLNLSTPAQDIPGTNPHFLQKKDLTYLSQILFIYPQSFSTQEIYPTQKPGIHSPTNSLHLIITYSHASTKPGVCSGDC